MGLLTTSCTHIHSGSRISKEMTVFIQPGIPSREEIESNFGQPGGEWKELRVIAYFWQTDRGTKTHSAWTEGYGFGRVEEDFIGFREWAFCLRFDAQDRVVAMDTLMTGDGTPISEAVEHWALTEGWTHELHSHDTYRVNR